MRRGLLNFIVALLSLKTCSGAAADDSIDGIQPAALDQPRIYLNLRRSPTTAPLATAAEPRHKDLLGQDVNGEATSGVEAFVDTGASGVMLSDDTARQLSIHRAAGVSFEDVGVAGTEKFGVSEPLFISLASYPESDPESALYTKPAGPVVTQLRGSGGILEMLSPGLDVLGTPMLRGKVIVLDPNGLADYDKIHTQVLEPTDRAVPKLARHVPLNEVSFARYTRTVPRDARGPDSAANPMIGPNPFSSGDAHPPVRISLGGKEVTGTFLLDTGAATSMISLAKARELGLKVNDDGSLPGTKANAQFSLAVGGLGGAKQSNGLYFDALSLPTREGKPIRFVRAPLLISDVSMADENGKRFTLDGVLGMNYLVSSAEITGGLVPDIGKIVDGPWKLIVIDLKRDELALQPK